MNIKTILLLIVALIIIFLIPITVKTNTACNVPPCPQEEKKMVGFIVLEKIFR